MKTKFYALAIFSFLSISAQAQSELYVDTTITAEQMVMDFFNGICVEISNVTYTGDSRSKGYFESANTEMTIPGGIILSSGFAAEAIGPNYIPNSTGITVGGSDPDLQEIANSEIYDASVLEFDLFSDVDDTLFFSYVFASEEYPEWTCSQFNDVFAFFVTGPGYANENIALIPDPSDPSGSTYTDFPVAINSVNYGVVGANGTLANCTPPNGSLDFSMYYIYNVDDHFEYDGMTVELLAPLVVQANATYHIKIAVADVVDEGYDSSVFIGVESLCGDSLILPPAEFQVSIDGNTVTIVNQSRYATSYQWDFGDGTISTERYPEPHTYQQEGIFTVSLITQNYCFSDTAKFVALMDEGLDIDASTCSVEEYELNAIPPEPGHSGEWYIIAGGGTLSDFSDPFAIFYEPSVGFNVLEWRIIETSSENVILTDTFILNVNQLPQVSFTNLPNTFCEDDAEFQLTGTPSGGTFEGPGVSGGMFDPAIAGPGSHILIYNYTDANGCSNSDMKVVEVVILPIVNISDVEGICENFAPFSLAGLPFNGTFEGPGVIGNSFDPASAGVGNHILTYNYTDPSGCSNSTSFEIEVIPAPETPEIILLDNDSLFCSIAGEVYFWELDGLPLSFNAQQIPLEGDGSYTVAVQQSGCVSDVSGIFAFTGVLDFLNHKNNTLKVFPNPANTFIQIEIQSPGFNLQPGSVNVYNTQGQLVIQRSGFLTNDLLNIDVSGLSPGMYFIQIHEKEGTAYGKFLKE